MKKVFQALSIIAVCLCLCCCGVQREFAHQESEKQTKDFASYTAPLEFAREESDIRLLNRWSTVPEGTLEFMTSGKSQDKTEKNFTLMVYMVGSNLESLYGAATDDLLEMLETSADFSAINVLVCTGGCKRWNMNVTSTKMSILDLSLGENDWAVAETSENTNMGGAETLSSFVNYCTENYPAENYGLVLWDHGGGPLWGYASDELNHGDGLLLPEIRSGMDATIFGEGKKLDWVGYDACLMASLESARLWKDYANYLVASEELEAGAGWNYAFLSSIGGGAGDNSKDIAEYFEAYYKDVSTAYYNPAYTLSVMDLSKVDKVSSALDALLNPMKKMLDDGGFGEIKSIRDGTKSFGLSVVDESNPGYDIIDLCDFAERISGVFPVESAELIDALREMVVCNSTNVERANGVSIYFPSQNSELYRDASLMYFEDYSASEKYWDFVTSYAEHWLSTNEVDWRMDEWKLEGDEYLLQLTDEQADNLSYATYSVMQEILRTKEGAWFPALLDVRVYPDENNILRVPADPDLFAISEEGEYALVFRELEKNREDAVYKSVLSHLLKDPFGDSMTLEWAQTKKLVTMQIRDMEDKVEVMDFRPYSEETIPGKGEIDMEDFYYFTQLKFAHEIEIEENGNTLPIFKWKSSLYAVEESYPLTSGLIIEKRPATAFPGGYLIQVTAHDVNGVMHGSECVNVEKKDKFETFTISTEKGKMRFKLYENHAESVFYEGLDKKVVIPSEVEGKHVTCVAWDLSEIDYPEDDEKNVWNTLKKVIVPSTVKEIGEGSFRRLSALSSVELGDSVKVIGDNAFDGCERLNSIILPESLRKIGNMAFHDCESLKKISLPDGLTYLGQAAFGSCYELKELDIPKSVQIINGSVISYSGIRRLCFYDSFSEISPVAFAGDENLEEIVIRGEGRNFTVEDGVLFSKDGKKLILYPGGRGNVFTVPEGVEVIGEGAFYNASIQSIHLPASLREIRSFAFYNCQNLLNITIPDGVEKIGTKAFFVTSTYYSEGREQVKIQLGKNVRHLGEALLGSGGFVKRDYSWEVSSENHFLSSKNGHLLSKAGDVLLWPGIESVEDSNGNSHAVIKVPDGVATLDKNVFYIADRGSHFYLPDSLLDIAEYKIETDIGEVFERETDTVNSEKYDFVFHCKSGSFAEAFAKEHGIEIIDLDTGKSSADQIPAYLSEYKAPDTLGDDALEPIFALDGKLYRLPCPLSEFMDDGWLIEDAMEVLGLNTISSVDIKKGDISIEVDVVNFEDSRTRVKNCAVYGILFKNDSMFEGIKLSDDFVRFPMGLCMNFTGKDLEAAFEGTEFTRQDAEDGEEGVSYSYDNGQSVWFGEEELRITYGYRYVLDEDISWDYEEQKVELSCSKWDY